MPARAARSSGAPAAALLLLADRVLLAPDGRGVLDRLGLGRPVLVLVPANEREAEGDDPADRPDLEHGVRRTSRSQEMDRSRLCDRSHHSDEGSWPPDVTGPGGYRSPADSVRPERASAVAVNEVVRMPSLRFPQARGRP